MSFIRLERQANVISVVDLQVNGVGKSTNLAKICFWLIENDMRVLIAACDTFRAGAVEQLRTHTRHLNALHPPEKHAGKEMVQLYEKGYGKDAAGIAMEAIKYARDQGIDIVLVDTAGRMQVEFMSIFFKNNSLLISFSFTILINIFLFVVNQSLYSVIVLLYLIKLVESSRYRWKSHENTKYFHVCL